MTLAKTSLIILILFCSNMALAGWGAIAYNATNGRSGETHGQVNYQRAITSALRACGPGCKVLNWEHDQCNALATGSGSWGEGHGFPTSAQAITAAVTACGTGCAWRIWICK